MNPVEHVECIQLTRIWYIIILETVFYYYTCPHIAIKYFHFRFMTWYD